MELNEMPLDELKRLKKDVDKAIATFEDRRLKEAKAKLEAQAKEMGFTLNEVVGLQGGKKPASPPKYRHPENANLTWTGRGRKPNWISEALASGQSLEDFAI